MFCMTCCRYSCFWVLSVLQGSFSIINLDRDQNENVRDLSLQFQSSCKRQRVKFLFSCTNALLYFLILKIFVSMLWFILWSLGFCELCTAIQMNIVLAMFIKRNTNLRRQNHHAKFTRKNFIMAYHKITKPSSKFSLYRGLGRVIKLRTYCTVGFSIIPSFGWLNWAAAYTVTQTAWTQLFQLRLSPEQSKYISKYIPYLNSKHQIYIFGTLILI